VSDALPGSRVLDGRYGVEQLAMGMPKGRDAGLAYARRFIAAAAKSGLVASAIQRAGLRGGTVRTDPR
jgi:polar amino acid transport system substrate-binding protein